MQYIYSQGVTFLNGVTSMLQAKYYAEPQTSAESSARWADPLTKACNVVKGLDPMTKPLTGHVASAGYHERRATHYPKDPEVTRQKRIENQESVDAKVARLKVDLEKGLHAKAEGLAKAQIIQMWPDLVDAMRMSIASGQTNPTLPTQIFSAPANMNLDREPQADQAPHSSPFVSFKFAGQGTSPAEINALTVIIITATTCRHLFPWYDFVVPISKSSGHTCFAGEHPVHSPSHGERPTSGSCSRYYRFAQIKNYTQRFVARQF